jgi:hypothetical protein
MDWRDTYKDIELTPEEIEEAIFEGKVKKYFKQRADLKEQEDGMHQLREPKDRKQRPDVVRHVQQASEDSGPRPSGTGTQTDKKGIAGESEGDTGIREASPKVPAE